MAQSKIPKIDPPVTNATVKFGSGWADYIKFGRLVVVHFRTTTTEAVPQYTVLVSGLPRPDRGYSIGSFLAYLGVVQLYLSEVGELKTLAALSAANRDLRGSFAYISLD